MLIDIEKLEIKPGNSILIHGVDWEHFEQFLAETEDKRHTKAFYNNGVLELMAPAYIHELTKENLGDLVKAFFEEIDIENRAGGSTTFKNEKALQGKEPDECFYFGKNAEAIAGKRTLDLAFDPAPNLAIEADNTNSSVNRLLCYEKLGVIEVWVYDAGQGELSIYHGASLAENNESYYIPNEALEKIKDGVEGIKNGRGNNITKREFRAWVRETDAIDNLKQQVEARLEKAFEIAKALREKHA